MTFALRVDKGRIHVEKGKMLSFHEDFKAIAKRTGNDCSIVTWEGPNPTTIAIDKDNIRGLSRTARFSVAVTESQPTAFEIAARLKLKLDPYVLKALDIHSGGKRITVDRYEKEAILIELPSSSTGSLKLTAQETAQAFWDAAEKVERFLTAKDLVLACTIAGNLSRSFSEMIIG